MTDDQSKKIDELHTFFFDPPIKGGANRAQQIEEVLTAVRTSRNMARAVLWIVGFATAISVAVAQVKGSIK